MNITITSESAYGPGTISWEFGGEIVMIKFARPAIAVWSELKNIVIAHDPGEKKIIFFFPSGEKCFECLAPTLDGYLFMSISKNSISSSGITLIFAPDADTSNVEADAIQFELDFDAPNLLGKKIGIWRCPEANTDSNFTFYKIICR